MLGITLGVAALAAAGSYTSLAASIDGFGAALGVSAGLSLLAALAGSRIGRRQ